MSTQQNIAVQDQFINTIKKAMDESRTKFYTMLAGNFHVYSDTIRERLRKWMEIQPFDFNEMKNLDVQSLGNFLEEFKCRFDQLIGNWLEVQGLKRGETKPEEGYFNFDSAIDSLYGDLKEEFTVDILEEILHSKLSILNHEALIINYKETLDRRKEAKEEDEEEFSEFEIDSAEQRYFDEETETDNAIVIAKKIMAEDEGLVWICLNFIEQQYARWYEGSTPCLHTNEKLRLELRKVWDMNFLNFVQKSIWSMLKEKGVLYYGGMDKADHENSIYNSVFSAVHGDLYRFCAKVIDKVFRHYQLGY